MDPLTLLIAAVAAGAIVLIAVGLALSNRGGVTVERLERYAAGKKDETKGKSGEGGIADLISQSAALAQLNKVVERQNFGANLLRDLGAADLKVKPSEFLAIWAGTTIGVPVVMFFVGFVIPSLQNILILLLGAGLGFVAPRFWLARRKSGRLNAFN